MIVYLCITVDSECDKGPAWRTRQPLDFRGVHDAIVRRLQPLCRHYHAKATYLLSPEVIRNERARDALRNLEGSCELGTHLHGEFAEPHAFVPEVTAAFQRDYPREVERAKISYLTSLFQEAFGRRPTSFRAGRFGIGANSLGILEEYGYLVESSVTPWMDWSSKGSEGLSFAGAPTQPYRPDPEAPERPGSSPLWEVPVTIRPRRAQRLPMVGRLVEPRWLRPTRGTAEALCDVARDEIDDARARYGEKHPVVLTCMFHNVEVIPNASPYASTEADAAAIFGRLERLMAFAERAHFRMVGLSDLPEVLASAERA